MRNPNPEYRCYVLVNPYFIGIQAGIQAAHAVAKLMNINNSDANIWEQRHKTLILLNGGGHSEIIKITKLLCQAGVTAARFDESEEAAGMCATAVAFIVPKRVYSKSPSQRLNRTERAMFDAIDGRSLAR